MAIKTTESGPRHYYDENDPTVKYPGVTSIISMLPKDLSYWNAKMASELAVDALDYLAPMATRDRAGAIKFLAGAARRYSDNASRIGNEAHDLFERMAKGEFPRNVTEEMRPFRDSFARFLETVQPRVIRAEDVSWSDEHGYAGSFDLIAEIKVNPETGTADPAGDPKTLMIDYKTGKNVYEPIAMQLTAYAAAEWVIDPVSGVREAMPDINGGAVLHIRSDFANLEPVALSDEVLGTFLKLREAFLAVREWEGEGRGRNRTRGVRDGVLSGRTLWSDSPAMVTGTQRRAS